MHRKLMSAHCAFKSYEVNAIRYDTRCYFNVRSKADTTQLNLPHETNNEKVENRNTKK